MASVPARQPSQLRSSPERTAEYEPRPSIPLTRARSTTSEDSRTLALDNSEQSLDIPQDKQAESQQSAPNAFDEEEQKCWICFGDSSEDTAETSPWRDPCPCALMAHEECLLDWIADKEAPTNTRNTSIGPPMIECPQCKSEIKLARPKDYIVEAVRAIERLGARAITPGALTLLIGTTYKGSMALGMHSIYAVFGAEDGVRILEPLLEMAARPSLEGYLGQSGAWEIVWQSLRYRCLNWQLYLGVPMITPALILSRTSYGDSVVPIIPLFLIATHVLSADESIDYAKWPPSASFAFAFLPYLRSAYNTIYDKMFRENEERWLQAVQPRANESENDVVDAEPPDLDNVDPEDDDIFEVRIDGNLWEEWEGPAPNNPEALPFAQLADGDGPQVPDPAAIPGNVGPQIQNNQQPQVQAQGERRLSFSPISIAGTVLGALLFPSVAGMSGEFMKLILPRSWTSQVGRDSLFQHRWGRSLVGGCLFVVCKDALMLYVRWRMAQIHRGRRVLDYDRSKNKT